jgi:hypothetical protein
MKINWRGQTYEVLDDRVRLPGGWSIVLHPMSAGVWDAVLLGRWNRIGQPGSCSYTPQEAVDALQKEVDSLP